MDAGFAVEQVLPEHVRFTVSVGKIGMSNEMILTAPGSVSAIVQSRVDGS